MNMCSDTNLFLLLLLFFVQERQKELPRRPDRRGPPPDTISRVEIMRSDRAVIDRVIDENKERLEKDKSDCVQGRRRLSAGWTAREVLYRHADDDEWGTNI